MQRMPAATIKALSGWKLGSALRADGPGFERIKGLAALAASPIRTHGRSCITGGAGVSIAAGQLGEAKQVSRMLESTPAIHQNKNSESGKPDGLPVDGQGYESGHAKQTEDGRNHQARSASNDEPEQGTQNLSAIERVDGQNVKDQQCKINVEHRLQKQEKVVLRSWQSSDTATSNNYP